MRKKIVAGNWKMNKSYEEATDLVTQLVSGLSHIEHQADEVVLCPPALFLHDVTLNISDLSKAYTASQNCHTHDSGAYTGEISAKMIKSVGATYTLIGHSERRMYNHESDDILASKVNTALSNGLKVIFCCGESLDIRNNGTHISFVTSQLQNSLFHLNEAQFANIVIAYEPIWAIGTGVTATTEQAQDMHAEIRKFLATKYGQDIANNSSILYGGSCNPINAKELFSQTDVDGGLIGGASLIATDFISIIQSF